MRWDALFRDLEGQLEAYEAADQEAAVASLVRAEHARTPLSRRLSAAVGTRLGVLVAGAGRLDGVLLDSGAEWVLLAEAPGRQVLVPTEALLTVTGLTVRTAPPDEGAGAVVAQRLGLGHALRAIARDRAPVTLVLRDGGSLSGTLDRVGADHVELAEHPAGEPRRQPAVRRVTAVPFGALVAVRGELRG